MRFVAICPLQIYSCCTDICPCHRLFSGHYVNQSVASHFIYVFYLLMTRLLVGFGDFTVRPSIIRTNSLNLLVRFYDQPTKTVTRILLLPFAVLAIVQLTNQVGM